MRTNEKALREMISKILLEKIYRFPHLTPERKDVFVDFDDWTDVKSAVQDPSVYKVLVSIRGKLEATSSTTTPPSNLTEELAAAIVGGENTNIEGQTLFEDVKGPDNTHYSVKGFKEGQNLSKQRLGLYRFNQFVSKPGNDPSNVGIITVQPRGNNLVVDVLTIEGLTKEGIGEISNNTGVKGTKFLNTTSVGSKASFSNMEKAEKWFGKISKVTRDTYVYDLSNRPTSAQTGQRNSVRIMQLARKLSRMSAKDRKDLEGDLGSLADLFGELLPEQALRKFIKKTIL